MNCDNCRRLKIEIEGLERLATKQSKDLKDLLAMIVDQTDKKVKALEKRLNKNKLTE